MSGKYARKEPSIINKKFLTVLIVAILFLVISGIIIYVVLQNKDKNVNLQEDTKPSATQEETYISQEPTSGYNVVESTEPFTTSTSGIFEETTESIIVPGAEDADESRNFSAEFTAYRAFDTVESRRVSLREVFGSSYFGGTIAFDDDGTFYDNLSISADNYGAYAVVDDVILMTYHNDKNSSAEIISYDDYYVPDEIMINYSGYEVYFNR